MLVKRSCPKCTHVFERWVGVYVSLGSPIWDCPKCKAVIQVTHVNEWDLMEPIVKAWFLGVVVLSGIFYYACGGFFVFPLSFWLIAGTERLNANGTAVLEIGLGIGAAAGLGRALYWLCREIRRSHKRMRSELYRRKLTELLGWDQM